MITMTPKKAGYVYNWLVSALEMNFLDQLKVECLE